MYDLFIDPPAPLVPRHLRLEVPERMRRRRRRAPSAGRGGRARGHRRPARRGRRGRRDLAAPRLSQSRPRAGARARSSPQMAPGLPVSCSSEVVPEIREYERTSTTVANVYVMPLMAPLPRRPRAEARRAGHPGPLLHHAVLGRHRDAGHRQARPRSDSSSRGPPPARWPPPAPLGAPARGALLSFDMGGHHGEGLRHRRGEPLRRARVRGRARRSLQEAARGCPIRVPVIELIEIGAGGGSMARIDRLGLSQGRPRQRGRRPRPGLLRAGRSRAHRHRRRPRARLPRSRVLPRRPHAPRRRRGAPRDRGGAWRGRWASACRGGLGHSPRRQREHGSGRAHPRHRAWQGPARLSALRLRRRGPGARLAGGPHPQGAARARAVRRRRDLRATACSSRRSPSTSSAPRPSAWTRADWGRVNRAVRRDGGRGPRDAAREPASPTPTSASGGAPRCAMSARATRSRPRCRTATLGAGSLAAITAGFEAAYRALYSRTPDGRRHRGAELARGGVGPVRRRSGSGFGGWRPISTYHQRANGPARRQSAAAATPAQDAPPAYFPEAGGYVDTPVYDRYASRRARPSRDRPSSRSASPPRSSARARASASTPRRTLVAEPA